MNEEKKLTVKSINTQKLIKTTFKCPVELRDRLEQMINEYSDVCTVEEVMCSLLDEALKKYGF